MDKFDGLLFRDVNHFDLFCGFVIAHDLETVIGIILDGYKEIMTIEISDSNELDRAAEVGWVWSIRIAVDHVKRLRCAGFTTTFVYFITYDKRIVDNIFYNLFLLFPLLFKFFIIIIRFFLL